MRAIQTLEYSPDSQARLPTTLGGVMSLRAGHLSSTARLRARHQCTRLRRSMQSTHAEHALVAE